MFGHNTRLRQRGFPTKAACPGTAALERGSLRSQSQCPVSLLARTATGLPLPWVKMGFLLCSLLGNVGLSTTHLDQGKWASFSPQ